MQITQRRLVISSLAISLLTLICACKRNTKLVVEPISEEYNHDFLTGESLDTNFFNTQDVMQYYEVSKYEGLSDKQLLTQLNNFATATYTLRELDRLQQLNLLFYKKSIFINYNDHLYESARDNEFRRLEEYSNNLLATITFERMKENPKRMLFNTVIYDKNKIQIDVTDTIILR